MAGQHKSLAHLYYWNTAHHHDANHGIFHRESWKFRAWETWNQVVFQSLDRPIWSNCGPVVAGISLVQD